MPIADPTDLNVQHWYWADDPTLSGVANGGTFATWPCLGSAGDDLTGTATAFTMHRNEINGNSAVHCTAGQGGIMIGFGATITQPCDVFIVGTTISFSYNGTHNILEPDSGGAGFELGWIPDGGGGHRGRWHVDNGTQIDAPQDGRLIEEDPIVIHLRADGANSQVRVNGSIYWQGNFGANDLDGIKLPDISDRFYYGSIVIKDGLLTDQEIGELLEWFNGQYARPDWAPVKKLMAMVVPTNPPADADVEAGMRFAIEGRGHTIDYVASSAAATFDFSPYHLVLYAGSYADRTANAPVIRGLIDNGVPCWISLREPGMGATATDTVACQCDLASEVTRGASFAWGNVTTETASPITDFLGTPPIVYAHKQAAGEFAYIDPTDTAVGTLIMKLTTFEVVYDITAGTVDLLSAAINAPVILSGIQQINSANYFTLQGYQEFQHEIDHLAGTLNLPIAPATINTGKWLAPKYGEIVGIGGANVDFEWVARAGIDTQLQVAADVTNPTWITLATSLSGTTHSEDMSNTAIYPEGIDWVARLVWDDGEIWMHFGFKLISVPTPASVFIDYDGTTTPGGGATLYSRYWDTTAPEWLPGGNFHEYEGLAALVGGQSDLMLMSPPSLPTGEGYDVTALFRYGSLSSSYVGKATYYWAAEGAQFGLGVYAAGTGSASEGIAAFLRIFQLGTKFQACPDEGRTSATNFNIDVNKTPTIAPGDPGDHLTNQIAVPLISSWAWPSPCAENNHLIPVRLRVERYDPTDPTKIRIRAGMAGWRGTSYWLLDIAETFPFGQGGRVGWALGKENSSNDDGGFRDAYTLGVTAFPAPGNNPFNTEPSKPCVVELTVYETDRTTEDWRATTDPADATNIQILNDPDEEGNAAYGEQTVSFLEGRASIASIVVRVVDYPTVLTDQDSGIITSRLSTGTPTFVSAMRGRRMRLRRFIDPIIGWITIVDGPCDSVQFDASYSAYRLGIRDSREHERKTKAFQRGETTSLLPRGMMKRGAGVIAFGDYLFNTESIPLYGTAQTGTGASFVTPGGYYQLGTPGHVTILLDGWQSISAINTDQVVVLPDAEGAFGGVLDTAQPAGSQVSYEVRYPNALLWWRPLGGSSLDWVKIKPRMQLGGAMAKPTGTSGVGALPACVAVLDATYTTQFGSTTVRAAREIIVGPIGASSSFPTNGQRVEVLVQYVGPPTDSMPYHWSGSFEELLTAAYEGQLGSPRAPSVPFDKYVWDDGVPISTGIRYDAPALTPLTERVLIRQTEPVDDLRKWLEDFAYKPSGWAPAFDHDLRISPLHRDLPAASQRLSLVTIDNSVAVPGPGWAHGSDVVNVVRLRYERLFWRPLDDDFVPAGNVDGVVVQPIEVWWVHTDGGIPALVTSPDFLATVSSSVATLGEQFLEIEARAFAANQAIGVDFDPALEQAYMLGEATANTVLRRFPFGAPEVRLLAFRSATHELRPGHWVELSQPWMPEYLTQRRGLARYAQVLAASDLNCALREFLLQCGEPIGVIDAAALAGGFAGGGTFTAVAQQLAIAGGFAGGGTFTFAHAGGGSAVSGAVARGGVFTPGGGGGGGGVGPAGTGGYGGNPYGGGSY